MIIQMIVFLTIFVSIYLGMHWYVFVRAVHPLHLSGAANQGIRIFFLVAAFSFVLGQILSKKVPSPFTAWITNISSVWMGIIAISLAVFAVNDLLRLFFHTESFRYYSCITCIVLVAVISVYSLINACGAPVIKEITMPDMKLPAGLDEFRIVQLSDLHIDLSKSKKWLSKVVDKTNSLNPDLVVITGDLIDADLCGMDHFCEILSGLKSRYGVYAVTGNHEFYSGIPLFMKICQNSNIKVLRNIHETVAGFIELAGIDDQESVKRFGITNSDLGNTLEGIDKDKIVILLSHQPDVFKKSKDLVDIQLSGHTHNGQILPMDVIVQFYFKYTCGLYKENDSCIYTSPGTGTWGPPMRTTSKNEITLIKLKS